PPDEIITRPQRREVSANGPDAQHRIPRLARVNHEELYVSSGRLIVDGRGNEMPIDVPELMSVFVSDNDNLRREPLNGCDGVRFVSKISRCPNVFLRRLNYSRFGNGSAGQLIMLLSKRVIFNRKGFQLSQVFSERRYF